jgi:hypothetical protein
MGCHVLIVAAVVLSELQVRECPQRERNTYATLDVNASGHNPQWNICGSRRPTMASDLSCHVFSMHLECTQVLCLAYYAPSPLLS